MMRYKGGIALVLECFEVAKLAFGFWDVNFVMRHLDKEFIVEYLIIDL
jgi:hypothetical protein